MTEIYIPNDTLIYDIECDTHNDMADIYNHNIKFIGCYSYKLNQFLFFDNIEEFKILLKQHKFVVGFNNKNYDNPILINNGVDFNYKIIIDLYKVMEERAQLIKWKKTMLAYRLPNMSLDSITKELNLVNENTSKIKIDYSELSQQHFSSEDLLKWKDYTLRDIEITKKLFEWLVNQFDSWRFNLNEKDSKNMKHLTSSTAVYGYKVICNRLNIEEEYNDKLFGYNLHSTGAYVSYPAGDKFVGDIYCMDFNSLYPHCFIQGNLFGRNKDSQIGWHGNDKLQILGYYNDKEIHPITQVLIDIYNERIELKKLKDKRENGLKIVLNSIYGATRNNTFKHLYDDIAGEDCCLMGQQFIKLARSKFKDAGFFVLYSDTDSCYIKLKSNQTKEDLLKVKNDIITEIHNSVNFPVKTFDMGIDYEIKVIHFVHGDQKQDEDLDEEDKINKQFGLIKKNYLFLTSDDEVIIKNLGITKRNYSKLSKKIFWEKIVPIFKKDNEITVNQLQMIEWIKEYLDKDVSLIMKRFSVGNKKRYKSDGCLSMQIYNYMPHGETTILGSGFHFLIPNTKMGVGKGLGKYCTLDEYDKLLSFKDLNLNIIIKELKYFISDFEELILKRKKEIPLHKLLKQRELW